MNRRDERAFSDLLAAHWDEPYDQELDRSCGYTVGDFAPAPRDDRWLDAVFLSGAAASVVLIVVALVWITR